MQIRNQIKTVMANPIFSIILASIILYFDCITGPEVQFPILFIIPVMLITWHKNYLWGIIFSILLPLATTYYASLWHSHLSEIYISINLLIRITILTIFTYMISIIRKQQIQLSERINTLEKMLPICSFCKKIRDKNNSWHNVESYISNNTKIEFTHGVCPDCAQKHYKNYIK